MVSKLLWSFAFITVGLTAQAPILVNDSLAGWGAPGASNPWTFYVFEENELEPPQQMVWSSIGGSHYVLPSALHPRFYSHVQSVMDKDSVRIWRQPSSGAQKGIARIASHPIRIHAMTPSGNDGVTVSVYRNDVILLSKDILPTDPPYLLNLNIEVEADDELRFHCNSKDIVADWVEYCPIISLYPSSNSVVEERFDSIADFPTVKWGYYSIPKSSLATGDIAAYTPLVLNAAGNQYAHINSSGITWCRIEAHRQVPDSAIDCVRAWRAQSEGDVYVRTVAKFKRSYPPTSSSADAAYMFVDHNGARLLDLAIAPTDTVGQSFARRLHVQAGDYLFFRTSCGPGTSFVDDYIDVHVKLDFVKSRRMHAQFSGPSPGSQWRYESHQAGGAVTPMTFHPSVSAWSIGGIASPCRIESDRQGAFALTDSDRVWTAATAGEIHIDSLSNLRWAPGASSPVGEYQLWKRRPGISEDLTWARATSSSHEGVPMNARVVVLAGDELVFRLALSSGSGVLITELRITDFRRGSPPRWQAPIIDVASNFDGYTLLEGCVPEQVWNWGHYRIAHNLKIGLGGKLRILDSVVEFKCTTPREFGTKLDYDPEAANALLVPGQLDTVNVVWGGTKNNGIIMPTNTDVVQGTWFAVDTMIRYGYGLPFGSHDSVATPGKLEFMRVSLGEYGDGPLTKRNGTAVIRQSTMPLWLEVPMQTQTAGVTVLDLHHGVRQDDSFGQVGLGVPGASPIPGVQYHVRLSGSRVPNWYVSASGMSPSSLPRTLSLQNAQSLAPVLGFVGYRGGFGFPMGAAVTSVVSGPCTWQLTNCTPKYCGVYIGGQDSFIVHHGPTTMAELFLWGGVAYVIGDHAPAGRPNLTSTTIEVGTQIANNATQRLVIQRATVGPDSAVTRGTLNVASSALVFLEDCVLRNLDINAPPGRVTVLRSNATNVYTNGVPGLDPNVISTKSALSAVEPLHSWSWPTSAVQWLNWDATTASGTLGFQPLQVVGTELQLAYSNPPPGGYVNGRDLGYVSDVGGTAAAPVFQPRIVAPLDVRSLRAEDLYLVIKYRTYLAPGHGNSDNTMSVLVEARSKKSGWFGFTKNDRRFSLPISSTTNTVYVHLNNPNPPGHPVSGATTLASFPVGWDRLPDDADHLAIIFGTHAHDVAGAVQPLGVGDFVYLEGVWITSDLQGY